MKQGRVKDCVNKKAAYYSWTVLLTGIFLYVLTFHGNLVGELFIFSKTISFETWGEYLAQYEVQKDWEVLRMIVQGINRINFVVVVVLYFMLIKNAKDFSKEQWLIAFGILTASYVAVAFAVHFTVRTYLLYNSILVILPNNYAQCYLLKYMKRPEIR